MAGVLTLANKTITLVTATGPLTLMQLVAPSNQRVMLRKINVSMNGVTATDAPVLFDVVVQTTAGTMSSLTPVKKTTSDSEAIQMTAQHTATAEPTTTDVKWQGYYHEMTNGLIPLVDIPIVGGTRVGIRYTSGTLTGTVKVGVSVECEE